MALTIHTNNTATIASFNLSRNNTKLQQSLQRLSSGQRIVSPKDDAGGLAVGYKLQSVLKRTEVTRNNISNGISYLQVQDGAFKVMGDLLDRMAELKSFWNDISKNSSDRENYNYEFTELQKQLALIRTEKFNGVSLFSDSPGSSANPTFEVITTEDGITGQVSMTRNALTSSIFLSKFGADGQLNTVAKSGAEDASVVRNTSLGSTNYGAFTTDTDADNNISLLDSTASLGSFSVADFVDYIQSLANARAVNGGTQSRLQFSRQMLEENQQNLEAARGRIMDADMALESTKFARYQVLSQASASMVSQANAMSGLVLQLLQ